MNGWVSFHAVDLELFDSTFAPLLSGHKVQPETFVADAIAVYRSGRHTLRFSAALAEARRAALPPDSAASAPGVLSGWKARLEQWDWKPDEIARLAHDKVDPDLHLEGRPFLITEGSAERVAAVVDDYRAARTGEAAEALALEQLVRLDSNLARSVAPHELPELESDLSLRRGVLDRLRQLYDLPRAARSGETWRVLGEEPRPARDALAESLAWRVVACHALARPFWVARDVDGIDTVCRAAGIAPPGCLVPAFRLLGGTTSEFPESASRLSCEIDGSRSVGAFVEPADLTEFQAFLSTQGAKIIREATRHGEGPAAAALLKKVRECATYAENRGRAYVEASGIVPSWWGGPDPPF